MKSVRDRAYSLDLSIKICGVRLGWAGIIGLIPWIGDVIALLLALALVKKLRQVEGGLPESIQGKMMLNVAMDFGIGLIPIVGDFINIAYKANTRNFILLEKFLNSKYKTPVANGRVVPLKDIAPPQPATTTRNRGAELK